MTNSEFIFAIIFMVVWFIGFICGLAFNWNSSIKKSPTEIYLFGHYAGKGKVINSKLGLAQNAWSKNDER